MSNLRDLHLKQKIQSAPVFTLTQDPPKYGAIRYDPEHKYSHYEECDIKGFMTQPHPGVYKNKYVLIKFWDEEAEFMFEGEIITESSGEKCAKLWWE